MIAITPGAKRVKMSSEPYTFKYKIVEPSTGFFCYPSVKKDELQVGDCVSFQDKFGYESKKTIYTVMKFASLTKAAEFFASKFPLTEKQDEKRYSFSSEFSETDLTYRFSETNAYIYFGCKGMFDESTCRYNLSSPFTFVGFE